MIDGNILIMTTFCIGLSVDFSAHVTYMFMTVKGTKNGKLVYWDKIMAFVLNMYGYNLNHLVKGVSSEIDCSSSCLFDYKSSSVHLLIVSRPNYVPSTEGGGWGHIVFGADLVGVYIRVASFLHSVSWTNGWILTKRAQTHYWERGKKW